MELPPPGFRCSEAAAAAALEHLRGVEKQLQNKGLVFDKGTVQHLEDAIKAIKELEEERKRILELLEEETIKNCNLRVRVKGIPEIIMKEFEELVAAARRSRSSKIAELESAIQKMVSAIQQAYSNQRLFEERNAALCEEQKDFGGKHKEVVKVLNQQMATKHGVYIQINEFRNKQKEEEEECDWQMRVIEELQEKRAREVAEFEENQRLLERMIAERRNRTKDLRLKLAEKRTDQETFLAILKALREQIEEKNQAVLAAKDELAELLGRIKNLVKEHEDKKDENQRLLQMKDKLQNDMASLDVDYLQKKEALLQRLAEVEAELEYAMETNKSVRSENDQLRIQYETMLEEESRISKRRNQLADEFERLSNEVTEKLDRLTKRLVEIQNIDEEQEKMQDLLETAEDSYLREIASLELMLQREADRSKVLQEQLDGILAQYKKLEADHEDFMSNTSEKIERNQMSLLNLMKQNEMIERDLTRSLENIRILTGKLKKKSSRFKRFDDGITAELKKLEDEYNAMLKALQEKEQQLSIELPYSEKLEMKLKETRATYTGQNNLYKELSEEETLLNKSIGHSLREIARLRRLKGHLRGEINSLREEEAQKLHAFLESLKFLEKENYEANRKFYIVDAENARFRKGIAYLRAEISIQESEEESCRSKRQQALEETGAVHSLFDERWTREKDLWTLFLLAELKVLKALQDHVARLKKRNKRVDYVCNGLQLQYEGMGSLMRSKSSTERKTASSSPVTE